MHARCCETFAQNLEYFSLIPDHRKLIGTVIRREDYLVPKAGGKFDAEEYDAHPEKYRSIFAEKVCF